MSFSLAQCANPMVPCFVTAGLVPIRPSNSRSAKRGAPRRRYYARPRIHAVDPSPNKESEYSPSSFQSDKSADDHNDALSAAKRRAAASASGSACFLACVECGAVYALDAEELDSEPRPVQCALCRHEWLASDKDLLWGADHARVAAAPRAEAAAAAARRAHKAATSNRSWSNTMAAEAEGLVPTLADGGGDTLLDDEDTEGEEGDDDGLHIFVGNLSFRANEQDLMRAFASYGKVKMAHIPTDGLGASRGYGFVQMVRRVDGRRAMAALDGVSLVGRDISLSEARPRQSMESNGKRQGGGGASFRDRNRPSGRTRDVSQRPKYVQRRNQSQNNHNDM